MITIFLIFTPIWILCIGLTLLLINKLLLKTELTSTNFALKTLIKTQRFITKDEQIKGRKLYVALVFSTVVTTIIFGVISFCIFTVYQGIVSTTIVTIILVIILYIIFSKFIKALAYQLFEKDKNTND